VNPDAPMMPTDNTALDYTQCCISMQGSSGPAARR
jgi:hypothetical protein